MHPIEPPSTSSKRKKSLIPNSKKVHSFHITLRLQFYLFCQKLKGGQRDATQVLCNGFFATFFSILYLVDCGYGERPIDFAYDYKSTRYSLAILGTLCCSCGDTLASELGTALNSNSKTVFHVIKWKRVPKGVNGGISFYGTLSSGLGGLVVASAYFIMLQLCFLFQSLFGSCIVAYFCKLSSLFN